MLASGQINPDEQIEEHLFLGELSLDGSVRHTNGILPLLALAREKHIKAVFVPAVVQWKPPWWRASPSIPLRPWVISLPT
jgi:predicted ATPase with chaperone activity